MISPAIDIFKELTEVPTAPFYEHAAMARCIAWVRRRIGKRVSVRRHPGGLVIRYQGAGPGPALALAAHVDHPGFHLSRVGPHGAQSKLYGGLPREFLPGVLVEAFAAFPQDNRPLARGILQKPKGDVYPVIWTEPPTRGAKPVFAVAALPPFATRGRWLLSRSIDDLLGSAASLEALRRVASARMETNLTVLLHRAEEVGLIGALDLIQTRAVPLQDSILSIETSRERPDARPGRGPVIRAGDKACAFDPNLLALLDDAATRLGSKIRTQRTRLTGGSCEATAYLAFGYESAGAAIPLVNYHNGGKKTIEPEMVRMEDVEGLVRLLVEAARGFPEAKLRGRIHSRLAALHRRSQTRLRA